MLLRYLALGPFFIVVAFATIPAGASVAGNPCAVVTRSDASTALGAAASAGFAVGANRTNVSLGAPVTGPKVECRYRASTGTVDITVHIYANAKAQYQRERTSWSPIVDLSGIGDAAFYEGGSGIYGLKGNTLFFVSLNFKRRIANPRSPYPQLVTLAKIAASRL